MKRYIAKSLSLLLAGTALLALMLSSCSQELDVPGYEYVPEGEPARISVDVTVPAMSVQTRAVGNAGLDPDEDRARAVNDLWIGIYNVSSGVRTGQQTIFNQVVQDEHKPYGTITINNILTLSGMSYIVAVANVSTVKGISLSDGSTGNLQDLLAKADTWEKYKSIVRVLDDPVIQRGSSLVMSGVYQETPDNKEAETVVAELAKSGTPPEVAIKPGQATTNKLSGRIHLRRLDSYIRVNLIPHELINFTPKSWQIVNVPAVSYVHEQNGNGADRKPASQHLSKVASVFKGDTYFKSERYVGGTFRRDESGVNWFFDFYQMENKHQGLEGTNNYDDREREYKTTDGKTDSNTGWYKSLVTNPDLAKAPTTTYVEDDANLANNNASYMVITGDLDYWINENNEPVAPTTSDAIHRIAEATWTVHLGYCEGGYDESVKAKDFNCRRNTKYTYNIHIDGVDNIRVEAQKDDGEPQPGAEGIVNDIITDVYSLDAHYGVFNIQLTDNQRRNFTWRIQAWFGGEPIDMICGPENSTMENVGNMINLNARKDMYEALPQNQFYNWIQIRPTSGPDVIAHYPGDIRLIGREIPYVDQNNVNGLYPTGGIKKGKEGVWYLEDLRDVEGHPHPYDSTEGDEYYRWYTVFIDEYVWEYPIKWDEPSLTGWNNNAYYMYNGKSVPKEVGIMDPTDWGKFVGEPNRRLWITSNNMYISKDRESVYNNAIYFVDQESVQTYYSEEASYGIGVESTNESYLQVADLNVAAGFTWKFTEYNNGTYDPVDGLLNQFRYAQRYENTTSDSRLRWDAIYETHYDRDINGTTYRLRKGAKHIGNVHYDGITYYIRNHENEYMSACLSRNRDLNNDGSIGSNEIRWYLPTEKTYTRIILGAPSLRSPLFELNSYAPADIRGGEGKTYSHYAASNNRKIWAEELAATGALFGSGLNAGNLRCIRNIGQPTNWTPGNREYESVDLAYEHDATERTITMRYYDNTTLRQTYYGPGEFIRPHTIGSINSYAYPKFKYAKNYCIPGTNLVSGSVDQSTLTISNAGAITTAHTGKVYQSIDDWAYSLNINGICRAYYEDGNGDGVGTWRVPNITELGILRLLDILDNSSYLSSSQEYFDHHNDNLTDHRYMITRGEDIGARYPGDTGSLGTIRLRCVKDVR